MICFCYGGAGAADAAGLEEVGGVTCVAGGSGDGRIVGGGGCMVITGAVGGCGKASFFLIVTSHSGCFSCSSTISLESTSLKPKNLR